MGFQIAPLFIKEEDVAKMLGHNVRWLRSDRRCSRTNTGSRKLIRQPV